MLVLVGHDEKSFSLQICITKIITSIVQWVKDFSCSGLAMEALEQCMGCVRGCRLYIYIYIYIYMYVCIYICTCRLPVMYMYVHVMLCILYLKSIHK